VSLGIFGEFLGFSDYFSCFKVFSGLFLELLMHWKIISETKNLSFPTWAEPEGPTQSTPAQPPTRARPARAHLGPGEARPGSQPEAAPPPVV
jgi:hypothetical protein